MVERNPWHSRVKGPFPEKYGCVGVKDDGGGSMRGRGLVGVDLFTITILTIFPSENTLMTAARSL